MRRVHRALFVAFVDWKISATVPPIVVTKDPLEWRVVFIFWRQMTSTPDFPVCLRRRRRAFNQGSCHGGARTPPPPVLAVCVPWGGPSVAPPEPGRGDGGGQIHVDSQRGGLRHDVSLARF
jgi:hypothetical protein